METAQHKEEYHETKQFPEAKEKIDTIKKNLGAYFDTEYAKRIFEKSQANFGTIEEKKVIFYGIMTIKSFAYDGEQYIKREDIDGDYYFKKVPGSEDNDIIKKKEYTNALKKAIEKEQAKTIADVQEFLKNINNIIVIIPRDERDKSKMSNSNAIFDHKNHKIYIPNDVDESALLHEIIHALQDNFHRIRNLLILEEQKISTVSETLWNRFLQEHNKYIAMVSSGKEKLAELTHALVFTENNLKKLTDMCKDNLQDEQYLKEEKETKKTIDALKKRIEEQTLKVKEYEQMKVELDDGMEMAVKDVIFSDIELHARLFQLRYACKSYLGLELGSIITTEHINQLMENSQYLEDNKNSYDVIDYLIFVNRQIKKENEKPEAKRDINLMLELEQEKVGVVNQLLDLMNNDLVIKTPAHKEEEPTT